MCRKESENLEFQPHQVLDVMFLELPSELQNLPCFHLATHMPIEDSCQSKQYVTYLARF